MKPSTLKEIWSLWESMAECGQLNIGPQFSAQYKRLKIEVQTELIKYADKLVRNRIHHKKWLSKPENKAKVSAYHKANKEIFKVKALIKSRNGTCNV